MNKTLQREYGSSPRGELIEDTKPGRKFQCLFEEHRVSEAEKGSISSQKRIYQV
jgi:hypothetical protein